MSKYSGEINKMKKILVLLVVFACSQIILAQSDIQTQSGRRNPRTLEEIRRDNTAARMKNMRRVSNASRVRSMP